MRKYIQLYTERLEVCFNRVKGGGCVSQIQTLQNRRERTSTP